jgi:hypothetical protein
MKKILSFAIACLLLTACSKEPGSVSGNVYYKYNNFVGNKPDSGAEIKMYSLADGNKEVTYEATTDVQGNYKIADVVPGDYLVIVKSENTTALVRDILMQFKENSEAVNTIFGVDLKAIGLTLISMMELEMKMDEAMADAKENISNADVYLKDYYKYSDELKEKEKKLKESIPMEFQEKFGLKGSVAPKMEVKVITVEEAKDAQSNIDFGVTYN